jgi:hypothetical protein
LITQMAAWRAVPDSCRKRIERKARPPVRSICSLDSARVEVAGLAEVPIPGVALAAVPGLGARPFGTSASLPGAYATGCGPLRRRRDGHKGGQFEINTAWRRRDRRNRDLAAEYMAAMSRFR